MTNSYNDTYVAWLEHQGADGVSLPDLRHSMLHNTLINPGGAGVQQSITQIPDWIDPADDVADFSVVTVSTGSTVNSTAKFIQGAGSLLMAAPGDLVAPLTYVSHNNLSEDLAPVDQPLILSVYIPAILSSSAGMTFYISNSPTLSNARDSVVITGTVHSGWNNIIIDKRNTGASKFVHSLNVLTAGLDWAQPIQSFRLRLDGVTTVGIDKQVHFDSLMSGQKERTKIVITQDDNTESGYEIGVVESLKRNIPQTMFAMHDFIGNVGYMTLDQIQAMSLNPLCYVGMHGELRWDGSDGDPATVIQAQIDGLKGLGVSDCLYAGWPLGATKPDDRTVAVDVLRSLGVKGARTSVNTFNSLHGGSYDPLLINGISLNVDNTLQECKDAVDQAIEWGVSIVFYGHNYGAVADSTTMVTQDYIDLLDHIRLRESEGSCDLMRFNDFSIYAEQNFPPGS